MSDESMTVCVHPTFDDLCKLRLKARGFSVGPHKAISSLLSGRYASRLRGRGLTFEELRDYRPGDDIRSMDWKATARLRKPHVRVYCEERERPVLLVVDQRTSMFFGSARTTKATAATEVAALTGWRMLEMGDRVGALIYTDDDVIEIRPRRSSASVLKICEEMVRCNRLLRADRVPTQSTTLNDAIRRAINVAHHDYLVVLVTDFADADDETRELTSRLSAHNDVLAVLVYDPAGVSLPIDPSMTATDGRKKIRLAAGADFDQRYRDAFQARMDEIEETLRTIRIPILPICTHEPVPDQVMAALGRQF